MEGSIVKHGIQILKLLKKASEYLKFIELIFQEIHTDLGVHPARAPPRFLSYPRLYIKDLFTTYTPAEKAGLARTDAFRNKEMGYFIEQSTQPQTIGYSLSDSPIGLLAWIYEKLVNWTDEYPWEDDEG